MPEIFISYRRQEPDLLVAQALASEITKQIPVYHDTRSIAPGDLFPDSIRDALAECRILLALVGRAWVADHNLSRLANDRDWVRQELRTALQRNIRVVPLLYDAALPNVARLPEDLQPLVVREAVKLRPERLADDAQALLPRLKAWLGGQAPNVAREAATLDVLPYLCDRTDQEEAFAELPAMFDTSSDLMTCVVHGHEWEGGDELLHRFDIEGVLTDILGLRAQQPRVFHVQLSDAKLASGLHRDVLKNAIKQAMQLHGPTDAEMQAWLYGLLHPIVLSVQFTWDQYRTLGERVIRDLAQAWRTLLDAPNGGPRKQLPYPALLWINLTYKDLDSEVPDALLVNPLPKLLPVEEHHIRSWVGLAKVAPHLRGKKYELLDLSNYQTFAPGRLHMVHFAQAVNRILGAR